MWLRILIGCWVLVIVAVALYRVSRIRARDIGRAVGRRRRAR